LVYHSIGGHIQFIIILGQLDPEEVLEKYHEYIGRGHIPPFWSFGHHQCRWGYKSLAQIREMVDKYNEHDIPLDTFWSDLEYMDKKMIFTINEATHPSKDLNALIKTQDLHFVPLLDVGVSVHDADAMKNGKELNVFFRDPRYNNDYYKA
jgi:alpha-glucosidase (family GH31 glycosyl hydrolase)